MNDYLQAEHQILRDKSKEAVAEYLPRFSWDCCYTATFAQGRKYAIGSLCAVTAAIRQAGVHRAFVAAEQHKSGLWHSHGLLSFSHAGVAQALIPKRFARLGWYTFEQPRNLDAASLYISKYLMKDNRMEFSLYGKWEKPIDKVRLL